MILVHMPADGSQASFVSFPRDSYVDIPGLRLGQAQRRLRLRLPGHRSRRRRGRPPGRRPAAAGADDQLAHRAADRPLRRGGPARLLRAELGGGRGRGQPVRGGRRPPVVRRLLPRGQADDQRRGRAEVRPPAARAPPRRLRPHHPPAGLHRRRAAQDALRGGPARPRQAARAGAGGRDVADRRPRPRPDAARRADAVGQAGRDRLPDGALRRRRLRRRRPGDHPGSRTRRRCTPSSPSSPPSRSRSRRRRGPGDRGTPATAEPGDVTVEVYNGIGHLRPGRRRRRPPSARPASASARPATPTPPTTRAPRSGTPPARRRWPAPWPPASPARWSSRAPRRRPAPSRSCSARTSPASASRSRLRAPRDRDRRRGPPHGGRHDLHQLTGALRPWIRDRSPFPRDPAGPARRRAPPQPRRPAGHLLRRHDRGADRALGHHPGELGRQDGEPAAGRVRRRPGKHRHGGPAAALADRGRAAGRLVVRRGGVDSRRAASSTPPAWCWWPRTGSSSSRTRATPSTSTSWACRCTRWAWACATTPAPRGTSPSRCARRATCSPPTRRRTPRGPAWRSAGAPCPSRRCRRGGRPRRPARDRGR